MKIENQTVSSGIEVKGFKVLIREPVIPEKTKSGLIVPSECREDEVRRMSCGQVLAFGPLAFTGSTESFGVNVGDWVFYSHYDRTKIAVPQNGDKKETFYFINDDKIFGKILNDHVETFTGEPL